MKQNLHLHKKLIRPRSSKIAPGAKNLGKHNADSGAHTHTRVQCRYHFYLKVDVTEKIMLASFTQLKTHSTPLNMTNFDIKDINP